MISESRLLRLQILLSRLSERQITVALQKMEAKGK